jgi:hypothetical protein
VRLNKVEARAVATEVASRYRTHARDDLLRLLDEQDTFELVAPSGKRYQAEIEAVWDDSKGNNLRVVIEVDDGAFSAFSPLTECFIVAPDGSFVDEE